MVVFLSSDLMFTSRVIGAARTIGVPVALVADAAKLPAAATADCRLVIIDLALERLNLAEVVPLLRAAAPRARIVGYGAHVEELALANAAAAGCDLVLTRGQFNQQYAELLRAAAGESAARTGS